MFVWMLGAIALAFYKGQWAVAHVAILTACLFMLGAQIAGSARHTKDARQPVVMIGFVFLFMIADLGFNNGPNESTALPPSDFEVLTSHSQNETLKSVQRALNKNTSFDHRDRVEIIGLGFHWPNASMVHKLDNLLGYNPLRLQKRSLPQEQRIIQRLSVKKNSRN